MPFPFLIPAALSALGIGTHLSAKQKNEKAQEVINKAQRIYNYKKEELVRVQNDTENSLIKLGITKKEIYEITIKEFIDLYKNIKEINLTELKNVNEVLKFNLNEKEVLELEKMTDIYETVFSSAATSAVTGSLMALAINGSLPVVTSTLSAAGTLLTIGDLGSALSLVNSAFSFGTAMTPISAVTAPVVLFTAISAKLKADENLEKAIKTYSEAEVAVEQMENSIVMCEAIKKKADMFNSLLIELNEMMKMCNHSLENLIRKRLKFNKGKIKASKLRRRELELIAISRSLAGAIKTVLDTPILNEQGEISLEVQQTYDKVIRELPNFTKKIGYSPKKEKRQKKKLKKFIILILLLITGLLILFFNKDKINLENMNSNNGTSNIEVVPNNQENDVIENNVSSDEIDDEIINSDNQNENITNNDLNQIVDNIIDNGIIDNNIQWNIDSNGTLNIFGSGDISNYPSYSQIYDIGTQHNINKVIINEGITSIGMNAFKNMYIQEVIISDTVGKIENSAFSNCVNLNKVIIASSVDYIGYNVFTYCPKLTEVVIENPNIIIESGTFDYSDNVTILSFENSNAQSYASENYISFDLLER